MTDWYRRSAEVVTLTLHVQPGAKRTEIAGLHGEALKIRLAAPPVEGRANEALLKFIAQLFEVPLRQVELKQGGQSRHKVVAIEGSKNDCQVAGYTASLHRHDRLKPIVASVPAKRLGLFPSWVSSLLWSCVAVL